MVDKLRLTRLRPRPQIAKRQAVVNPENTFFSVKRFIGRVMNEVKRIREERAEQADFTEFAHSYSRHLEGMGVSLEEIGEIAGALGGGIPTA